MNERFDTIKLKLERLSNQDKAEVFAHLRKSQLIHPLEEEFKAPAEIILEAISRSGDLTKRGVRGIIAEASFKVDVLSKYPQLKVVDLGQEEPYDFLINLDGKMISIQVKMQRLKAQRLMMANEGYRYLPADCFVVETQRTRGGKDKDGGDTRPYRFGEFDILAVSMQPSTGDWKDFRYTLSKWLIARPDNPAQLLKFQPVPVYDTAGWTSDLETVIKWHVSGVDREKAI